MSPLTHPTDAVLERFALGEVESAEAVTVATHIDACPRCAARATAFDPLGPAFAAMALPEEPEGLVEAILDADRSARSGPAPRRFRAEPAVALLLMAASALLMLALGEPTQLVTDAATTARAAQAMAIPTASMLAHLPWLWIGLGVAVLAVAVVVAQRRDARGDP